MTTPLPEQDADFEILSGLGWRTRKIYVSGDLDGLSAVMIEGDIKMEVYQGCAGVYENVPDENGKLTNKLVRYSWFEPTWIVYTKHLGKWKRERVGRAKDAATGGDMATAAAAEVRAASRVLEPQF